MRQNLNARGGVSALPTGFLLQFTNVLPETLQRGARPWAWRLVSVYTVAQGCSLWLSDRTSACGCAYLSDSAAGGLDVDSVSWGAAVQFPLRLCKSLCGCFGHAADDDVLELTWLHLEGLKIKVSRIPEVLLHWRLRQSHSSFALASPGTRNHVAAPRWPESLSSLFQTYPS